MSRKASSSRIQESSPPAASPRRSLLPVLVLLGLLLLGAAGGVLWWRARGDQAGEAGGQPSSTPASTTSPQQRAVCSDDDDPKYLEQLEFGPPIEVAFDRRHLDALAGRPLAPEEVYPWQPEGLVAVLGEHRMRGALVAPSADGKLVAVAASGSPHVRIGSTENLHEKAILKSPRGVLALTWSPQGDLLAVSCGDGIVRLFNVGALDTIPAPVALAKAGAPIQSLSWSGDAKYLIGGDRTLRAGKAWVWDVATHKLVQELLHESGVMDVAFSPVPGDYRALTCGGREDGQLYLWEAVSGKEVSRIDFRPQKTDTTVYVASAAFAPDGKRALSCHPDGAIRVWDLARLEKGGEIQVIKEGARVPPLAVFSPDGGQILSASSDTREIRIRPSDAAGKPRSLAKSRQVHALHPLGTGEHILFSATTGQTHNVHLLEVASGKEVRPPVGHLSGVACVALSPDGGTLASGGSDYTLRAWDLQRAEQRHVLSSGHLRGVDFAPDGKRIFYWGNSSGALPMVNTQTGKAEGTAFQGGHAGGVASAAITLDGRYAVTGGMDASVRMWRLEDGIQVRHFDGAGEGVPQVTLCPDMRRALRAGSKRTQLLHLRCQEAQLDWKPHAWAPFLPDGRALLFGGTDTPVVKVTGESPGETDRLSLHIPGLAKGHLSADGKRVAAIAAGNVVVLDPWSGGQLWKWTVPDHFGGVADVMLSSDGGHLATANGDGTVYVIRLP